MRRIGITETREVPPDGLLLGYGSAAVFPAAALLVWLGLFPGLVAEGARLIGAALLCFLGGVRRGLSFRTEGGPRPAQLAAALALYAAGLAVLVLPLAAGIALLVPGFGALIVADPLAARRGEVPLYFARLRPPQMAIAAAGSALLLWAVLA